MGRALERRPGAPETRDLEHPDYRKTTRMETIQPVAFDQWRMQYLEPLIDRVAHLDWQIASLQSRLMVAERLTLQLTAVMTEPARINAVEEVRESVVKELNFAQQNPGHEILAQHLQDQITQLDKSLETMRAKLAATLS